MKKRIELAGQYLAKTVKEPEDWAPALKAVIEEFFLTHEETAEVIEYFDDLTEPKNG